MLVFAFLTPYILSVLGMHGSDSGYEPNWFMSAAFLENYKMICTNDFPNVSPLTVMWSLCVEEHFYILWGLLFCIVSVRHAYGVVIGAIIAAYISRFIFYLNGWSFLDLFTNLDYFAVGAIPAILLIRKKDVVHKILAGISSLCKVCIMVACVLIFILLPNWSYPVKPLLDPVILGMLFLIILTLIVFEEQLFRISKKNIFSRLDIYTYSLYLMHTIVINLFVVFWREMNEPLQAIGFVTGCLLVTIAVSMASYYIIENPFLKLKKRIA